MNTTIKKFKVNELVSPEYNPRTIDEESKKGLKKSLETFGYVDLLIVNERNNHVVGGNQRLSVLKELGYKELDCVVVDLDDHEERKLNVVLNSQYISGRYDMEKLSVIIEEIKNDVDFIDLRLDIFDVEVDDLKEPENLTSDSDSKPPRMTLTFPDIETYELFKSKIDELIEDYPEVTYSVGAGEL